MTNSAPDHGSPNSTPPGITEFTLSPEARARVERMNLIVAVVFAALFTMQAMLYFVIDNPVSGTIFVTLAVFMLVSTLALSRRFAQRSRLRFGDGSYEIWWSFRTQRFSVADVAQVVTGNDVRLGFAPSAPVLLIVGPTKRITILTGIMWSTDQLGALALDLAHRGVPMLSYPQKLNAVQLRSMDKRWMPFWQAHPIAIGLLAGFGVVVIAVVAVVVAFAVLR